MNAAFPAPRERGNDLLAAHCASLDPEAPTARERLELALGVELAHKLVFALTPPAGASSSRRARFAA